MRHVGYVALHLTVTLLDAGCHRDSGFAQPFAGKRAQAVERRANAAEVEQSVEQPLPVKRPGYVDETDILGGLYCARADEVEHIAVGRHHRLAQRSGEHHTLESAAAAQCHIDLPGSKGPARVDDCLVEGQPLAFVYGDGPGQSKWYLTESAVDNGLYRVVGLVDFVTRVLPRGLFHLHFRAVVDATYPDA